MEDEWLSDKELVFKQRCNHSSPTSVTSNEGDIDPGDGDPGDIGDTSNNDSGPGVSDTDEDEDEDTGVEGDLPEDPPHCSSRTHRPNPRVTGDDGFGVAFFYRAFQIEGCLPIVASVSIEQLMKIGRGPAPQKRLEFEGRLREIEATSMVPFL